MKMRWSDTSGEVREGAVPPSVSEFIDLIGEDKTALLLLKVGGTLAQFSEGRTHDDTLVARAIGREAALTLGQHFGAVPKLIPMGNKFLARHLRAKGYSVQEIARLIRCTAVSVRSYLKPDPPKGGAGAEPTGERLREAAKRFERSAARRRPRALNG